MPIEEVILPKGTISYGRDWSEHVVKLELLQEVAYITYTSQSIDGEKSIEINRRTKTVAADNSKIPRDFYSLICAVHAEIKKKQPYNQYEQVWGFERYKKIIDALTIAEEYIKPEKKSGKSAFSFDPRILLKLQWRGNNEGTEYTATPSSKEVKLDNEKMVIERKVRLTLVTENTVTAAFSYFHNGERIAYVELEQIDNQEKEIAKKLTRQFNIETTILQHALKD